MTVSDQDTLFPRHPLDEGWNMLPRWLRRIIAPRQHAQTKEKERRVRQMDAGILNDANRGTTRVVVNE